MRVYWDKDTTPPLIPKTAIVPMQPGTTWGGVIRNEQGDPDSWSEDDRALLGSFRSAIPIRICERIIDEETITDNDGRWQIDVMPDKVVEDEPRIFLSHPDYVSDQLQRGIIPWPVTERPTVEALRAQTAVMTMRKEGRSQAE